MAAQAALVAALLLPVLLAIRPPAVRDILGSSAALLALLGLGLFLYVLGVRLEFHPLTRYEPALMANSGAYVAFLGASLACFGTVGLWQARPQSGLRALVGGGLGLFLLLSGIFLDDGSELLGEHRFWVDGKAASGIDGLAIGCASWMLVGWLSAGRDPEDLSTRR